MASRLPPKKDVAIALLERSSVYVHLDPRREQVVVPGWLKKRPQLVLQVGLNMPVPIPDLSVDDECVSCTLSFNRSPFFCWIPWTAIYALVGEDGRGMVWPDDIPAEVAAQAQRAAQELQQHDSNPPRARGHLRAVKAGEEPASEDPAVPEAAQPQAAQPQASPEPAPDIAPPNEPELASLDAPAAPVAVEATESAERSDEDAASPPDAATPDDDGATEDAEPKKRKLPPYLRIVK